MPTPVGRRRARMAINRRRQIQLSPDEQAAFFRERKKAALATIDKDGFPHVVAMNYFVRDGAFYMTSYGKAQKVVNVRRNPKVALMVESGDTYAELRGVMIRGHCEILEGEDAVSAAFEARGEAQASPSPVQPGAVASAPERVVLKIVPQNGISWGARERWSGGDHRTRADKSGGPGPGSPPSRRRPRIPAQRRRVSEICGPETG